MRLIPAYVSAPRSAERSIFSVGSELRADTLVGVARELEAPEQQERHQVAKGGGERRQAENRHARQIRLSDVGAEATASMIMGGLLFQVFISRLTGVAQVGPIRPSYADELADLLALGLNPEAAR